jgi:predicted RNA methylase
MIPIANKIERNPSIISTSIPMKAIQTKGLQRNTIDKYYTNPTVVNSCIQWVTQHISINQTTDLIIEPSAGNGSFIQGIKSIAQNYRFYDLEPEHCEIIQQDYLSYRYLANSTEPYSKIHVIGNPPFGRQSSLAIRFIKKSCEFCHSISFILPKSFKKDSLKKTFPLDFHLVFESDLPEKAFLVDGKEYTVPCIFQIWERRDHQRPDFVKMEPAHFRFVHHTENPHISFRRVGVNAGTVDTQIAEKSPQSHYFIQFTNRESVDENITRLSQIEYDFDNTVGPKSISKQELIRKWNPLL